MILYYFFPAYISQTYVPIVFYYFQIGEWFYVAPGEEIAIFSAEHDKFVKISYEKALENDVREYEDLKKALDSAGAPANTGDPSTGLVKKLVDAVVDLQTDELDNEKREEVKKAKEAILEAHKKKSGVGDLTVADKTKLINKKLGYGSPILIFRPFQTVRCCFPMLLYALFLLALTQSFQLLYPTQWTMASCILVKAGSELGNTFRK